MPIYKLRKSSNSGICFVETAVDYVLTPATPIPIQPLSPWCYMVSLGGGHMPRLVLKNVTKSGAPTHAMLGKGAGVVSRSISEHLNDILFFYQTYHNIAAICREIAAIWREKC